jgi:hypothetical protein
MLDLIGYGIRITLNHPVQLGRLAPEHAPAADTIILARPGGEGQKVLIVPGETSHSGDFEPKKLQEEGLEGWVLQQADDGTRVVLGESKELGDLAEVSEGPKTRRWELKSAKGYAGHWLKGFNVLSTDEQTTWPFELIGHDGSLAYVRGPMAPDQIPEPEQLAVQDQELLRDETDSDAPWVELGYEHDGQQWRLSYHFVTLEDRATLAVCVQASADGAEQAQQRGADFAQSLRLND